MPTKTITEEERLERNRKAREWKASHKEHVKAARKSRIDKTREQQRAWRLANGSLIKEYKQRFYIKNRDKIRKKQKEWYDANIDKIREKDRGDYHKNKEWVNYLATIKRSSDPGYYKRSYVKFKTENRPSYMFSTTKNNAKSRGIECTLTRDWFVKRLTDGVCELTGIAFDLASARGPNSPTVDRIVAGGPYTPENCRLIIWSLNRAISDYGDEYMLDVCRRYVAKFS